MPQVDEATIQHALTEYHDGVFDSYRAAGRAYGVHHSTLARRDQCLTTTRSNAHENQFLLSKDLEDRLSDWILFCEICRFPVAHRQIREFVSLILATIEHPANPR